MRATMGMLFLLLWPVLAATGQPAAPPEGGAAEAPAPPTPDPDYVPKVGDRAVLYSADSGRVPSDLWCATTSRACREFIKGLLADDKPATDNLAATNTIVYLEPQTEIQVVAREAFEVDGGDGEKPLPCTCLAVLVLSGPSRGKTLYTMDFHVSRLLGASPGQAGPAPPATSPGRQATATPGARVETPAPAPQPDRRGTVLAEQRGVISLDSLAPVRPAAPPATATATATATAPGRSAEVISLDSLAPVRPSAPPAAATATAGHRRVITLESPADAPPPSPPPAAPTAARDELRTVSPAPAAPTPRAATATTMTTTTVPDRYPGAISLDPPAPRASLPAPRGEATPARARGAVPAERIARAPSTSLPPVAATVPPRTRGAIAAAPALRAPARPSRAPVATATAPPGSERLVPGEPPAPIQAFVPPPPLSAAGMLASALDSERQGKRIEALSHYRALIKAHPDSREGKWAAGRITAMTNALELEAQEARAASVLKRAADLEASGDVALALTYFRQVVKVYPRTPSARTAAARIRALGAEEPAPPR